ncbi:hypothetical protein [Methylobacterium indicum]|uniref:hypothetical protein n=1 Tax=Methylobacterium indicum TaxID=1775910 RepID=UPI0009EC7B39|nr:hypothetical protein [Methylobacterium indicum]
MTVHSKYANSFAPVKYFLSSYRALCDGRSGVQQLEEKIETANLLLSDWKVNWIGACSILRVAIDLLKIDAKSCLKQEIKDEISKEWMNIKKNREEHAIFWQFLKKERDSIIHGYEWQAYEAWMKPDGTFRGPLSLLAMNDDGARPVLRMRGGFFEGHNSLDLLKESADWVEERIMSAIRRAGYDPEESRGLLNFELPPKTTESLLGGFQYNNKIEK